MERKSSTSVRRRLGSEAEFSVQVLAADCRGCSLPSSIWGWTGSKMLSWWPQSAANISQFYMFTFFPLIHLLWLGWSYSSMFCCASVETVDNVMKCPGLRSEHVHGLAFTDSAQLLYLEINVIKTKHNKKAHCGDANHCTVTPLVLRNHVHLSQISSTLLRCGVTIQSDLRKITSTQPHWQISSKLLHSC